MELDVAVRFVRVDVLNRVLFDKRSFWFLVTIAIHLNHLENCGDQQAYHQKLL